MQSYGTKDDATNSKYDYEILKFVEYTSLVQKREIVQRKGRCKEKFFCISSLGGISLKYYSCMFDLSRNTYIMSTCIHSYSSYRTDVSHKQATRMVQPNLNKAC